MNADQITAVERIAQLFDKYGMTTISLIVLAGGLAWIVRLLLRGDLVPRWMLERAEHDRDEVMAVLKNQETGALREILEFMRKIKVKDDVSGGGG